MEKIDFDILIKQLSLVKDEKVFEKTIKLLSDIRPLIENMSNSIIANMKSIPLAAKRLSYVDEVTENAASEIMSVVEGLFHKIDAISEFINFADNSSYLLMEFINFINDLKDDTNEIGKKKISDFSIRLNEIKENHKYFSQQINKSKLLLSSIFDDLTSIMMTMQWQDITAQQISAITFMLKSVHVKLYHLIQEYKSADINFSQKSIDFSFLQHVPEFHRDVAFDDSTLEFTIENNQVKVDSIIDDDITKELLDLLQKSEIELMNK